MTEQTGTAKAWGGRFAQAPDRRLEAFNASVAFDVRLVREDIRGSIAHARMLGKQGIISAEDAVTLERGLWQVLSEVEDGDFTLTVADEDVHTGVERRLREIVGARRRQAAHRSLPQRSGCDRPAALDEGRDPRT